MKWKKLGKIFSIDKQLSAWCVSHTSAPFPEKLEKGIFRIYFSCRDKNNYSTIAYIDYDMDKFCCMNAVPEPVLRPGQPGLFDDCGCFMGSIVRCPDGGKNLYYQGWNLTRVAPQGNFIGLATYDNTKEKYVKYSRVPVLDRTDAAPFSLSMPIVIYDNGKYRMWFGSNKTWSGKRKLDICIRTAESNDGIHWEVCPIVCIDQNSVDEYSFAVSTVLKDKIYKMFYSYRGESYRIGYAESEDGYKWKRKDNEIQLDVAESGWDSQMIEYPSIFDYDGRRYMLYCGNGYGKSGIGLAVQEDF